MVVDVAAAVDQDGCDVYFLNRPASHSVKDPAIAAACFKAPPNGSTPISHKPKRAPRPWAPPLELKNRCAL